MAKIKEEKTVITLSKLVANHDDTDTEPILGEEECATLKEAVEGLIGDSSIIVEIE